MSGRGLRAVVLRAARKNGSAVRGILRVDGFV